MIELMKSLSMLYFNPFRKADLPVSADVRALTEMPRSGNEVMSRKRINLLVGKWNIHFDYVI